MLEKLKLSHHQHSGRLRPHEHTSYGFLFLLLALVGGLMAYQTVATYASSGPGSGSVSLTGSVPSAPPTVAATITSPHDGQHFTTSPITVSGTCPTGLLVEIYKNNIFAGSIPCGNDGSFSLQIDLLYGQNTLTAQVYDALNQAGPVSRAITVFYDSTAPQAAATSLLSLSGTQFILLTNAVYRGTFPNQQLNMPISVIGGTPPFAINVEWDDTSNQVLPRPDNTQFNASHTYKKAGVYEVTLQGTDSKNLVAFLKVAAIVNGQPSAIGATSIASTKPSNKWLALWPIFAIAVTMVTSFWYGERREKKLLAKANKPPVTPLGVAPQPHI